MESFDDTQSQGISTRHSSWGKVPVDPMTQHSNDNEGDPLCIPLLSRRERDPIDARFIDLYR